MNVVAPVVAFGTCTECPRPVAHRKGMPLTLYCSQACNKVAYYRRHPDKYRTMLARKARSRRIMNLTLLAHLAVEVSHLAPLTDR